MVLGAIRSRGIQIQIRAAAPMVLGTIPSRGIQIQIRAAAPMVLGAIRCRCYPDPDPRSGTELLAAALPGRRPAA
jgi:hypothetical protein